MTIAPTWTEPLRRQSQKLQRQWRTLPLLDRWLFAEMLGPLLFGIAAFTAVSLSVGVVFELVRKVAEAGLPLWAAGKVLALRMPGFLVLSFPMATLMATLLAFSRLSGSSELTALRSIGVKTWRMVVPALVLAALMTLLTFVFNDVIVPSANYSASNVLDSALGRALSAQTGKNVVYSRFGRITPKEPGGNAGEGLTQLFYAKEFKNGEMQGVTLLDFSREDQQQVLTANTAVWDENRAMWEFRNGRILNIDAANNFTTSANYTSYYYPFTRAPQDVGMLPSDAAQMTVAQARRAEALLVQAGDQKEARRLRVRIQEKFAFPAICLVFGLIGSSLGVRPNSRTSRSQGFGISVLLIFGYYLMSFIFSSLGIKGTLYPFFAAWLPVLIGLGGGLVLLRKASR
ncbi:LptF/LptG family permease [Vulcanococcus sp. CPBay_Sum15L08_68]|uniref:LptF/LptG family permease n=1 Tax=Vulcanococcus sp. CPBay_Sum15L08_68 TaxID=2806295 RepID=UPI000D7B1910|nr:LptF/LptG family permease [Vulcanococcus sp. CPBay_Sum15L08_68]NCV91546.1 YjgP/YjgQ family permease [Synechococcaceae bacterium WB7_3xG_012]PWL22933.1 MAG: permease [Synechococcus sp. XM-24]